ncbi:MAG: ubiquitin-like protein Pup [Nostocoides sp.]
MSNHEQIRAQRRDDGPDDDGAASPAPQGARVDADIDGMLDEIDGVLESNAEEFVRTFVQKGGQ